MWSWQCAGIIHWFHSLADAIKSMEKHRGYGKEDAVGCAKHHQFTLAHDPCTDKGCNVPIDRNVYDQQFNDADWLRCDIIIG